MYLNFNIFFSFNRRKLAAFNILEYAKIFQQVLRGGNGYLYLIFKFFKEVLTTVEILYQAIRKNRIVFFLLASRKRIHSENSPYAPNK
jgi:hypothetical protein